MENTTVKVLETPYSTELKQLETELDTLLKGADSSWISISKLILKCQEEELWKPNYRSFNNWLNSFAETHEVTPSLLWKRHKAGTIYKEYAEQKRIEGQEPEPIGSKCSPEALEFAKKIAGRNKTKMVQLVEQAVSGQASRATLERQWKAKRAAREKAGLQPALKSRHDAGVDPVEDKKSDHQKITALDIIEALNSPDWLRGQYEFFESWAFKNKRFYRLYDDQPIEEEKEMIELKDPRFFKTFAEFRTGKEETSERVRRLDYLILENYTEADPNRFHAHGFEIKVTEHDLLRDGKMGDYVPYVNSFWLAVPIELKELALDFVAPGWGVLTVDQDGIIEVQQTAKFDLHPPKLNETLMTVIEKMIIK